ncbi:MAG TPA: hypothetical protein VIH93_16105, partial [Thermoanaerobaculia bacterium]
MRLTPFAKLFITVVIVAVLGYALWHYKGGDIRHWAGAEKQASSTGADSSKDFSALKDAPADPGRDTGSNGVAPASLATSGKLSRPRVVGINTWAGHSPGIVFNNGMEP